MDRGRRGSSSSDRRPGGQAGSRGERPPGRRCSRRAVRRGCRTRADRRLVDLTRRTRLSAVAVSCGEVAALWPEFAACGKDQVTVGMVAAHTVGLPCPPPGTGLHGLTCTAGKQSPRRWLRLSRCGHRAPRWLLARSPTALCWLVGCLVLSWVAADDRQRRPPRGVEDVDVICLTRVTTFDRAVSYDRTR